VALRPANFRNGFGISTLDRSQRYLGRLASAERTGRIGFADQKLYKTDAFLKAHPFGTVPAAFSPDGCTGIFESNSIMRAVARLGAGRFPIYGRNDYESSRIDAFLDASLVFARDGQIYLLALNNSAVSSELYEANTWLVIKDVQAVLLMSRSRRPHGRNEGTLSDGAVRLSGGAGERRRPRSAKQFGRMDMVEEHRIADLDALRQAHDVERSRSSEDGAEPAECARPAQRVERPLTCSFAELPLKNIHGNSKGLMNYYNS
jgi:hypothetical protein